MRWLCVLLLLPLAGCVDDGAEVDVEDVNPLSIYLFTPYDPHYTDGGIGYMARIHNPSNDTISYEVEPYYMVDGRFGPVFQDGPTWNETATTTDTLAPNGSRLWLFDGDRFSSHTAGLFVQVGSNRTEHTFSVHDGGSGAVRTDQHYLTYTVGVWINGTSFYTNMAGLNEDPAFPAGYDRSGFGGDALPIYVYDQDRSEQPPRSKDTCHFTTITGYNALLKTQFEGGTGVRFLTPEEGYTRPGAEEHFLYGEPLIFMNTVAAFEPRDERLDDVPDPQGECFDQERYTGIPLP